MREDWIKVELGKVCTMYAGTGFPKKIQGKIKGRYPFYKVGDISRNVQSGNQVLKFCDNYIDEDDIKSIKGKVLPINSIVFAKIGEALKLNRRAITKTECLVDNNAVGIKALNYIEDFYLFFYFLTIRLEKYSRATTVPSVRKSDIEEIIFPLAPLPIQRAIVSKIESLFSDLDNGIANLKKAQEQLKIYRQAVLKKAFEGERYDNFEKSALKNIAQKIGSGSTPKGGKANYKQMGIPLIRSMNIHFNYIKYKDLAFIDDKQAEKLKNVIVNTGDVLLNITGASIGRVNIAPKEFQNGRVNQHVSIIRVRNEKLNSKYLKYFIQSPNIQSWIDLANYGATRQALTKSMLENLEVPLPSIPEQHQIVQEIESRLSVTDNLEIVIRNSLLKAEALRQSILKKAFEGKLLSEAEIEACKQEKDYEPANVLLKKIKAEKLKREKEAKKTKRKIKK